ncbi:MAG TPA: hypothetical protein VE978_10800 [Chitinophagales bacterium]|nr:hypothetical protein [Chitinophagales bacterium]
MNPLTDLEYRMLDELYFVSSFQNVLDNLIEERSHVIDALKNLLENNLVTQVKMESGREEKLEVPDFAILEESYFVASKKGLLLHNSRN